MTLKTLNDLDRYVGTRPNPHSCEGYHLEYPCHVEIRDLRQEAIKWIKELQETKDGDYICIDEQYGTNCDNVINWIKHFFNITKEDLK